MCFARCKLESNINVENTQKRLSKSSIVFSVPLVYWNGKCLLKGLREPCRTWANSIHFLPSQLSQCNAGAYYTLPLSCNLPQLSISLWRIVIPAWNTVKTAQRRPECIGSLILRNVSASSAGAGVYLWSACVHMCAKPAPRPYTSHPPPPPHLVYQPRLVIYKTFVPSLGEKREEEREAERRRRV